MVDNEASLAVWRVQEAMAEASAANKLLDHRRVAPEGLFRQPRLYLVGEAPGAVEAAQGKPFVGPGRQRVAENAGELGSAGEVSGG
jgi:DNA polymerase